LFDDLEVLARHAHSNAVHQYLVDAEIDVACKRWLTDGVAHDSRRFRRVASVLKNIRHISHDAAELCLTIDDTDSLLMTNSFEFGVDWELLGRVKAWACGADVDQCRRLLNLGLVSICAELFAQGSERAIASGVEMINAVQDLSEEAAHWSRVIHDATRLKVAKGPTDGWCLSAVAIMVHKEEKPRQASLLKGLVNLGVVDICERLFTEGNCFDSSWAKGLLRILWSVNQDARLLHELFTDISELQAQLDADTSVSSGLLARIAAKADASDLCLHAGLLDDLAVL